MLIPRLASAVRLSRAMGQRASAALLGGRRAANGHATTTTTAKGAANAAYGNTTAPPPALDHAALEAAFNQPLPTSSMAPSPKPLVLVVSGPSGVGKDAVLQQLRARRPGLRFVVTATTRARRPNEVDGVDYHFVSKPVFERWIETGQLLEHALVYGEYKGIPKSQVDAALAAGEDVVLRLDVQGAATVRSLLSASGTPHASVFVVAESAAALARRLAARGTEDSDALRRRFREAEQEIARLAEFDYVVVNREGKLEECVDDLGKVIDAHKLRVGGCGKKKTVQSGAAARAAAAVK